MRPTPIPDSEVWEDHQRRIIAGPNGDLTDTAIAPVEALIGQGTFSMRLELEDGDLGTLAAGGVVWLTILGERLQPFAVAVAPAAAAPQPQLQVVVTMPDGETPRFDAQVHGVSYDNAPAFIQGCVEALQKMLDER